jgi:hypothetical protein
MCPGLLELLAVEGEARTAGVYEVQLLMARVARLVVGLDDILSGSGRRICIAAECPEVEVSADWTPGQRTGSGDGLDVLKSGYRIAHRATA